jgi:hypothetical protein
MLWIFPSGKIRRLRSGANPRSWVPEASMQTPRPPKPLIRSPDLPARSQSLYRLSYPAHTLRMCVAIFLSLMNTMEQCRFSKSLTSQKIPGILWNILLYCRISNILTLIHILSQMNLLQIITLYSFKTKTSDAARTFAFLATLLVQISPPSTPPPPAHNIHVCEIWGSHESSYEEYCRLGCDTV